MPKPVKHPAAEAVWLSDAKLKKRMYYRERTPWGTIFRTVDDPDAVGELVILPE